MFQPIRWTLHLSILFHLSFKTFEFDSARYWFQVTSSWDNDLLIIKLPWVMTSNKGDFLYVYCWSMYRDYEVIYWLFLLRARLYNTVPFRFQLTSSNSSYFNRPQQPFCPSVTNSGLCHNAVSLILTFKRNLTYRFFAIDWEKKRQWTAKVWSDNLPSFET